MIKYVCGFAFSGSSDQVLLVKKERPPWQAGRWNGVGGHIEPGEDPLDAMVREFLEETGLTLIKSAWKEFARLVGEDFHVTFFVTHARYEILRCARSRPDGEMVRMVSMYAINATNAIPNLTWLLPMARNLPFEISPKRAQSIDLVEQYRVNSSLSHELISVLHGLMTTDAEKYFDRANKLFKMFGGSDCVGGPDCVCQKKRGGYTE